MIIRHTQLTNITTSERKMEMAPQTVEELDPTGLPAIAAELAPAPAPQMMAREPVGPKPRCATKAEADAWAAEWWAAYEADKTRQHGAGAAPKLKRFVIHRTQAMMLIGEAAWERKILCPVWG